MGTNRIKSLKKTICFQGFLGRLLTDEANLRVKSSFQRIFSPLEIIFSLAQPIQMSLHDFTNQKTFFLKPIYLSLLQKSSPRRRPGSRGFCNLLKLLDTRFRGYDDFFAMPATLIVS
jgi:hypothetical protein